MDDVKPQRRPYRSRIRKAQAAETREAMLAAAHTLFLQKGWAATTIAGIAAAADVSKETVYAVFGAKAAILKELIVNAVRGTDHETPLVRQDGVTRIAQETDQARQIDLFAAGITDVLERVAPLMDLARAAAGTDEAMADLHKELQRGRLSNLEWFAAGMAKNGALRDDMAPAAAARIIWRLASPDLFLLVRRVEGTSRQAYVDWLAASLKILLLPK